MRFLLLLSLALVGSVLLPACEQARAQAIPGAIECSAIPGECFSIETGATEQSAFTPIFDTGNSSELSWGPDSLSSSITINSTTVTAAFRYEGSDATSTTWPDALGGDTLPADPIAGTGAVSLGNGGPWVDGSSAAFFGASDYVYGSAASNDGVLATGDFVLEAVVWVPTVAAERYIVGRYRNATNPYFLFYTRASGSSTLLSVLLHDGTTAVSNTNMGPLVRGSWNHILIIGDRSGSCRSYINGTSTGSFAISSSTGSYNRSATKFLIGAFDKTTAISSFDGGIALVQLFTQASWLDSDVQTTWARERFAKLTGFEATLVDGTKLYPTTINHTSAAKNYVRICDQTTDTTTAYAVGQRWIKNERACSRDWTDPTTNESWIGPKIESTFTNLVLQSADLSTSWATIASSITVDQTNDPEGNATLDAVNGTTADAEHGVSQDVTLTADDHAFSVYARAGNQSFIYLEDATVTGAWAYFDTATCAPSSLGSGARTSYENLGGGLCRAGLHFIGTAAVHTFRALCAQADGDKVYVGATGDCYLGWAQVSDMPFAGSYIATTTGAVSKPLDDLRWTLPARDIDQTTILVDGFFPEDGFDTSNRYVFTYTDGASASDITTVYSAASQAIGSQWFDGTTNVSIAYTGASPFTGARHIVRQITDVANTTGNICVDGTCSGVGGLASVCTQCDEFVYSSRTYGAQGHANYWQVRIYASALMPD